MQFHLRTTLLALAGLGLWGASSASAQVYRFEHEENLRRDVPGLEPRLDWIRDEPPIYDKQSYRTVDLSESDGKGVFVRFLPGTPAASRTAAHLGAGIRGVVWQSQLVADLYLVRIEEHDVHDTIQRYLDHPDTLYAEPNMLGRRTLDPNDAFFASGHLWGIEGSLSSSHGGSRAEWAFDEHQGAQDFVVAIIDSGINYTHDDLSQNMWSNLGEIIGNGIDDDGNGYIDDHRGWDFSNADLCFDPNGPGVVPCFNLGDSDPMPTCNDHGSHVAGTVGARGNNFLGVVGVNWVCSLMNLKCEVSSGGCDQLTNTVLAFDYAVANGARVSNHSYGHSGFSMVEQEEIQLSQAYGHVFVTSAGNSYQDIDAVPQYPAAYSLSNIVSVANIEDNGELYESCDVFGGNCTGSNWGATQVDLGAPGTGILSTSGPFAYEYKTGTSMASPHVAGAVALIMSRYPNLEWWRVRDRILNAARPEPTLAGKCVTGGILDVHRALGIWAAPSAGGLELGAKQSPLGMDLAGFTTAVAITPDDGVLNLFSGNVSLLAAQSSGVGGRSITLQASGGPVLLGTP